MLPNVQVDGTLNIEGEVFIPTGATFSKVVETEGNQTIDGVKTFTSSPIVTTPTAGDNSTKVATTAFVKAKSEADSIGVGQTWLDVTASRNIGVSYTNSTGKPIFVCVLPGDTGQHDFLLNGVVINRLFMTTGNGTGMTMIVPNGATYSVNGGTAINVWAELR